MTVKQLIKILSTIQDQDTRVMVKGYEGGYNDIEDINPAPIDIALDVNDQWYYGKHEMIQDVVIEARKDYSIVKAIIL
jgi:hypothetical protein